MTPRRTLLAGIPISLAASVVTSTAQAQSAPVAGESTIQSIVKRGRLLVGLSTFVPWAMRDKNGELIGFERVVPGLPRIPDQQRLLLPMPAHENLRRESAQQG